MTRMMVRSWRRSAGLARWCARGAILIVSSAVGALLPALAWAQTSGVGEVVAKRRKVSTHTSGLGGNVGWVTALIIVLVVIAIIVFILLRRGRGGGSTKGGGSGGDKRCDPTDLS